MKSDRPLMPRRSDWRPPWLPVVVAIGLVLAWFLYPPSSTQEDGRKEIVLWMKMDPLLYDPIKPALAEFERRHPEYKVRLGTSTTRNEDGDPTRFLLGVAGGVPPDLIFFDRFAIVEWASRGAFADLNAWITRDAADPASIHPVDYFPSAWGETQWAGGTYAIPTEVNTRALYYQEAALVRAGLVRGDKDPVVIAGQARAGVARPPASWEELSFKLAHLTAHIQADGSISSLKFLKQPAVNESRSSDQPVNLRTSGARAGDVVVLLKGERIFRGRIGRVEDSSCTIDMQRDQAPGVTELDPAFTGACEVKIYSQDDYVTRLSRFDPESGRLSQAAFLPLSGNSWLYLFGWQNGGEFMSADGKTVLLDSPKVVAALQWLEDVYDEMGGYQAAKVFENSASLGGLDPFLSGKIVMFISVSNFLNSGILAFDPRLDFGLAPAPLPKARLAAGATPISWSGGFAYAIPATAQVKEGAWELLKWLSSAEANRILVEAQTSLMRARGMPYLPAIDANRKNLAQIDAEFLDHNPAFTPQVRSAARQFRELVESSRYRPVTPVGQRLWSEHARATEAALMHVKTPYEALAYGTAQTQGALEAVLHPPAGTPVAWPGLLAVYIICLVVTVGILIWRQHAKGRLRSGGGTIWYEGYLAASPWLLGFVTFGAGPILFSAIISFCSYDVLNPAVFTGWRNYVELVGWHQDAVVGESVWNDPLFWKSLENTLVMVLSVPLSIALGLGMSMLLNLEIRGVRLYRTLFYLPAIVPAVAGFMLWIWIFDPTAGILNLILRSVGWTHPPAWLQDAAWAKPALIMMGLWGVGGSTVIWIAGLKDVPVALYEASELDGASRWQQFIHVTAPMLSPYILFNMIMGLIAAFQIFDAAYVMTDGGPADSTLFFVYKLFNEAFRYLDIGHASAMAWLLFVIVLAVTLLQLWLSKRWVHYRG